MRNGKFRACHGSRERKKKDDKAIGNYQSQKKKERVSIQSRLEGGKERGGSGDWKREQEYTVFFTPTYSALTCTKMRKDN